MTEGVSPKAFHHKYGPSTNPGASQSHAHNAPIKYPVRGNTHQLDISLDAIDPVSEWMLRIDPQ